VAQVVKHLPSKREVLSLHLRTTKKEKRKKERKKEKKEGKKPQKLS
jgi:hypothetical protein